MEFTGLAEYDNFRLKKDKILLFNKLNSMWLNSTLKTDEISFSSFNGFT